jgi:spermidine synthase
VRRIRLFLLLYFLSGSAALLYEVVWLRLLTLSMGHTAGAVGTVLAAFMGGLAAGAWVAGRAVPSQKREQALRTYAALELTIAACALLLPLGLIAVRPVLAWAYANGAGGGLFETARVVLSLLLVSIPAAAMGASYPIGVRCVSDPGFGIRDSGSEVRGSGLEVRAAGLLYASNTIGAATGAVLTGFVLLPLLGLFGTTLIGVVLNLVAAIGALLLRRGPFESAERESRSAIADPKGPRCTGHPSHPSHLVLASSALAVSGFVALVYEVTWTRILALILGPTTYAFSAMLVAFIGGLAIGSAIAAAAVPRMRRPGLWLGVAMVATAAIALVACARVDSLPLAIAAAAGRPNASFTSVFAVQIGLAIALQMPMTIALGTTFPLAIAVAAPAREEMSADAAAVYTANTAGAIAGALATSFVLIPRLGLQASVQLASVAAIATGLVVAWRSLPGLTASALRATASLAGADRKSGPPSQRWLVGSPRNPTLAKAEGPGLRVGGIGLPLGRIGVTLAAVAATVLAVFIPPWNHERMANGAYRFAPSLAAGDVETGLEAGRLSYYGEGAAGTVSVKQLLGVTSLAIDGKVDASNGGDMLTQKLLAHLPLLLHDSPRSVYVIGLGSGVTLGSALRHPIERATVSEISPEVVSASEAFAKDNHEALHDPRTRLIVGDGRSHLLLSTDKYDVIISEPSNPWMAGVSTLFTREFFLAARSRLEPGGVLCQWAHTYNISDEDLRSIVATFLSTFPDGSAWLVGEGDLLLIGSMAPIHALEEGVMRGWQRPGVAADLADAGVRDPFSVLTLFVARGRDLQRYAGAATIQSDDALSLEFSAPRAVYGQFERGNVDRLRAVAARAEQPPAIRRVRAMATALEWRHRAQMELAADAPELAYQDFAEALAVAPDDVEALDGFARAAAAAGRLEDAETYLQARASGSNSVAAFTELSAVLAARGRNADAALAAQHAAVLDPSNPRALDQLISVLADGGNDAALEQLGALLKQTAPESTQTMRCGMRLAYLRGDFAQAAQLADRLATVKTSDGDKARTLNMLGSAYAALGDRERARKAFRASLEIAPRDPAVLVNLGMTELRSADAPAAAERFSEALFLYPTLGPALDGLAQALEQQGQTRRAATIRAVRGRAFIAPR